MLSSATSVPLAKPGSAGLVGYVVLSLLAVVVLYFYGLDLPLQRDNAQYLYTGQRLLHGEMPYQTLFDMKTPLTSFAAALALLVSQPFFEDPLIGVRLVFMGVTIATILLIYAFARKMFKNTFEAYLPPLMMIGFHGLMFQAAIGARTKPLLLLFFVPGLMFLLDKRWFALGLVAAVCSFIWQPSGVLLIAALVYAFLQPNPSRWPAVGRLILGFVIPSAVIFGYFLMHGALRDLLDGAFGVHLYLSRPDESEIWNIIKMFPLGYPFVFPLMILSLGLFVAHAVRSVAASAARAGGHGLSDDVYVPYLIILALFTIASLLDFQSYSDYFVFLPFTALGIVFVYRAAVSFFTSARSLALSPTVVKAAFVAILLVVPFLNVSFSRILSVNTALWRGGLIEQRKAFSDIIKAAIGSYDANSNIIVIGMPEIPALLGFRNATQHSVLGAVHGYDNFIASKYPTGFTGWLDEMSRDKPQLIIVKTSDLVGFSKANHQAFVDWLNRDFTKVSSNEAINTEKFRSVGIDTWVPKK